MKIGTKVIIRSNEWDQPYYIGEVIGSEDFGGKGKPLPVVKTTIGDTWVVFGCCVEWSAELELELTALTPQEQWNRLSNHINYENGRQVLNEG